MIEHATMRCLDEQITGDYEEVLTAVPIKSKGVIIDGRRFDPLNARLKKAESVDYVEVESKPLKR